MEITWKLLCRLPGKQKAKALALILLPCVDSQTGYFKVAPKSILAHFFEGGPERHTHAATAVNLLRNHRWLENRQPVNGLAGQWYLCSLEELRAESEAVRYVEIRLFVCEFVARYGVRACPELIKALMEYQASSTS